MSNSATHVFGRADRITEGWYWALRSADLRRGRIKPVTLLGRDLAVYRGTDGKPRATDAYCPHMGCHLGIGKVEGNSVRCFFHGWKFDENGHCEEIPALPGHTPNGPRLCYWPVRERHGLIWIWVGDNAPSGEVADPPIALAADPVFLVAGHFTKGCHPNVVLVNAIDEHHFRTVHRMPGQVLNFECESVSGHHLAVRNTGAVPDTSWAWRLFGRLYRDKALYYETNYFYGSSGIASLGPSWFRMHLLFATRPRKDGKTEGITVALTRRRAGLLGAVANRFVLFVTAIAGQYFAHGDTKVFDNIRFRLQHPIRNDRTVSAYISHVEQQTVVRNWAEVPAIPPSTQVRPAAE